MKHIKHSIIRSICTIVLILTVFCACNLSLSACTFSPPLTRAYLIETFDITEADLEGINVEAVTEYYDLRQNITPENVSDIINRLKTLEADMIEETSQPLYFTTYIYTGKAARKAFSADDIKQRYCENRFIPCSLENWQLNEESYRIALKAVCPDRKKRYSTISEFWVEWKKATALF